MFKGKFFQLFLREFVLQRVKSDDLGIIQYFEVVFNYQISWLVERLSVVWKLIFDLFLGFVLGENGIYLFSCL